MNNDELPTVTVLLQQSEITRLNIELSSSLSCFDGHFPGAPVLPGVVMLHWVTTFARQYLTLPAFVVGQLEVIKFQKVLVPDTQVELVLEYRADKQRLYFSFMQGEQKSASGRLALKWMENV